MIEIIQKPADCYPPYLDRFKAGDVVICLHTVVFCDGDRHLKGNEYIVEEKTKDYYNVCYAQYKPKEVLTAYENPTKSRGVERWEKF